MIQRFISTLCLLCIGIAAFAQILDAKRVIISLHDGSVFIGRIVQEDELNMDLLVITQDTVHIQKGLIKDIRRNSKDILIHSGGKMHYTGGPFFSINFGMGGNLADNPSADLDVIYGQRINKRWSVGGGVALSLNSATLPSWQWITTHFMPVFAYGRYYINDKKVRPFAHARLGYGFRTNIFWNDEHTGGLHFQPGVGIHFASRKSSRFVISLSQMLQNTKGSTFNFDVFSNPVNFNSNHWYNRTILKIGIEFK